MSRSRARSPFAIAALAWLAAGCVFVPATLDTYDPECRAVSRHMVLQSAQIAAIDHCSNQGCAALVVAAAATAAASAIVSGSVVLIGNAVYWVERRSSCRGPAPPRPPVAPD
ncbi:MAG: hypothetical protein ABW032_05015 [Burkholderiaceae bacterium]